jgi:hypothetical protein
MCGRCGDGIKGVGVTPVEVSERAVCIWCALD